MGEIFNKKLAKSFRIPLLAFTLFPHLMILGMFTMNATFTASFLDLEADDLQFLFAIAYATIVCTLFVHVRFFQFFNIRNYLLLMTSLSMLLIVAMMCTSNTQLLYILRIIQGPLTLLEGCILLPILMSQMKGEYAKIVAYSILYGLMLTSDKISLSIFKFLMENFSFEYMLFGMIVFHAIALMIYLILFNHNRMFPKKPLYQLNITGMLLLMICLIAGAFFFIYGKKYDWFESPIILFSLLICIAFAVFFILYQQTIKRPQFHFQLLKSKRILVAIGIFFIFYILRASMSNLYQVMGQVWQWPWTNVLNEQYYSVFASLLGVLISVLLMIKQVANRYIFSISFLLMGIAMVIASSLMFVDVPVHLVHYPLLLMGLGQGLLFTPLVLFMLGSVNPAFSSNASVLGTATRFWSSVIGFSLMQNLGLKLTAKNQDSLIASMEMANPDFGKQWNTLLNSFLQVHLPDDALNLTAQSFQNQVFNQALLLGNITVFNYLALLAIVVAVLCLCYSPIKKVITYLH